MIEFIRDIFDGMVRDIKALINKPRIFKHIKGVAAQNAELNAKLGEVQGRVKVLEGLLTVPDHFDEDRLILKSTAKKFKFTEEKEDFDFSFMLGVAPEYELLMGHKIWTKHTSPENAKIYASFIATHRDKIRKLRAEQKKLDKE